MKIKKLFFLHGLLLITLSISSCELDPNGVDINRRRITVETNLSKFQIGQTIFDSTKVYPYVLSDETNSGESSSNGILTIQPVQETGFIKFIILGGRGKSNSNVTLNFKDSLTINTPIDTTTIFIRNFSFD